MTCLRYSNHLMSTENYSKGLLQVSCAAKSEVSTGPGKSLVFEIAIKTYHKYRSRVRYDGKPQSSVPPLLQIPQATFIY